MKNKQGAVAMYYALIKQGMSKMKARTNVAKKYNVHPNTIYLWSLIKMIPDGPKNYQLKNTCLPSAIESLMKQPCTVPWGVRILAVDGEEWFVARLMDSNGQEVERIAGLVIARS